MRTENPANYAGQVVRPHCGIDGDGNRWPVCAEGYSHADTCEKYYYSADVCPASAELYEWPVNPNWNEKGYREADENAD